MNKIALICAGLLFSLNGFAANYNHHGGLMVDCEPAHFFDEFPAKDAKVASFQTFKFTASDNTVPDTIKVWFNNEPVDVAVTQERSGRFIVEGRLKEPVATQGRAWLRVTADSVEGCDQFMFWNVYINP